MRPENNDYLSEEEEERRVLEGQRRVLRKQLQSGLPIVYADPEYPDEIIEEHPDGRRFVIGFDESNARRVLREVKPATGRES